MCDTLARLQHALERNRSGYRGAKPKAVELSDGSDQGAFKDFLNELMAEKAKSNSHAITTHDPMRSSVGNA